MDISPDVYLLQIGVSPGNMPSFETLKLIIHEVFYRGKCTGYADAVEKMAINSYALQQKYALPQKEDKKDE